MKTKSFVVFSVSVVVSSALLIVFHSQPPALQTIVRTTHRHIKHFQENLKDVEENNFLLEEEKYFKVVGFNNGSPAETWHNTSVPCIVSYALGDAHAQAVGFVRNILSRLPNYTVLLYNLGLSRYSLGVISSYCNSSKCVVLDFDLDVFPSHVNDEGIHAFRPLIIQHALSRVGGVVFLENDHRFNGTAEQIDDLYKSASKGSGILAWPRRPAVSSLTHPRMFEYFHTTADNFLFLPMVDVEKLIVVQSPDITNSIMRPWIQCALTHDCIMPIGAQSGGCRFDKKPQYRYSGCHSHDASALNIALGLHYSLDEDHYTYRGTVALFSRISNEEARQEYSALERNATSESTDNYKNEQSEES